jgi:2-dehydropantoate 2-reductase
VWAAGLTNGVCRASRHRRGAAAHATLTNSTQDRRSIDDRGQQHAWATDGEERPMPLMPLPIAVLGGGSLGLLFAAHLARCSSSSGSSTSASGSPAAAVQLILRTPEAVASYNNAGSTVRLLEAWRPGAQWATVPLSAVALGPEVPQRSIQHLILATKAAAAVPALLAALPFLAPSANVVLLQNGMLGVLGELLASSVAADLDLGGAAAASDPASRRYVPDGPSAGPKSEQPLGLRLFAASVTHGCYRPDAEAVPSAAAAPFSVVHAGNGAVTLGPLAAALEPSGLAAAVRATGPGGPSPHVRPACSRASSDDPTGLGAAGGSGSHEDDPDAYVARLAALLPGLSLRSPASRGALRAELLAKLATNCTINPLTALLGCRNGALLDSAGAEATMRSVCEELLRVFGPAAFGLAPASAAAPGYADASVGSGKASSGAGSSGGDAGGGTAKQRAREGGTAGELEAAREALLERVRAVARATAGNRSSMLADVAAGRPTEVSYLNGYVARTAIARGVDAPVNAALCGLVRARGEVARE